MHLEASASILKECCNLFYFLLTLNHSMHTMGKCFVGKIIVMPKFP